MMCHGKFDTIATRLHHRRMLQRLAKLVVVLTLTLSLGTHWAFLQSVAWVGMVMKYSRDATIAEAVSKTFDGQHPCKLCKFVQQGKATEKKQDTQKPLKEVEKFLPAGRAFALFPPQLETVIFSAPNPADSRVEPPPIPPPERA